MGRLIDPRIAGMRVSMLIHLYRKRLRAHPLGELLAGGGVAVGVALVFGVLVANASLTSSAGELVHGLVGSARYALVARSAQGMDQALAQKAGELPGVRVAAPVLRANATLTGPNGKQEAVQLIGVTASLEALGGAASQQYAEASVLLKGGVGLPVGMAKALGVRRGDTVRVAGNGMMGRARVRVLLGGGLLSSASSSPVAVSVLAVAQRLARLPGRVSEVLIEPAPGQQAAVAAELRRLANGQLDVRPADYELGVLAQAIAPTRKSTSLFEAISVMIGFLLALNAMLLTVPERRKFIAELRMQGYDPRQVLLLLVFQALVLGLAASLVGIVLGDLLSRALFESAPSFLGAAFPIGVKEVVGAGTVALALVCGVLASCLASLSPLLDLRPGRPADAVFREVASSSELISARTTSMATLSGGCLILAAVVAALMAPAATIAGGVALALASVCLIPAAFVLATRALAAVGRDVHASSLFLAPAELRATTTRSVALAAIVAIAVYGGVAIGGARDDLLRGIQQATDQYFSTAPVWVTSGRDVFNTGSFAQAGPHRALENVPGVASVRVYRGGLLDVGRRRVWVRARPPGDGLAIEPSQLREGDLARANRLIEQGAGVAVSSDYATEHGLRLGMTATLPTPSGPLRLPVVAILTNSGWPGGSITLGGEEYARWWGPENAAALEVSLMSKVSQRTGARRVRAALTSYPGLQVRTAGERETLSESSARQGLHTLSEISALLLIAAALAVASALSAAVWQRRMRMAALKLQGYDSAQLWRAVLLESAVTVVVGGLVGALVGVGGHALASRFLERSTGFPAPFSLGLPQALETCGLIGAIALLVIAVPGMLAARVQARVVLAE